MIYALMGAVVIASIFIYVFFLVFFPEWVGVTGKVAQKNLESHEGKQAESDALSRFLEEDRNSHK